MVTLVTLVTSPGRSGQSARPDLCRSSNSSHEGSSNNDPSTYPFSPTDGAEPVSCLEGSSNQYPFSPIDGAEGSSNNPFPHQSTESVEFCPEHSSSPTRVQLAALSRPKPSPPSPSGPTST